MWLGLIFSETSLAANYPYLGFDEEEFLKKQRYQLVCKNHPTVEVYHDAINAIKDSDVYRLRPGNLIIEQRNELAFGPISKAFGTCAGVFNQLVLSPATLLASPWIIKRHIRIKRIEKVSKVIDELYFENKGTKNLEGLLEFLQLSYPLSDNIQQLELKGLQQLLRELDKDHKLCPSWYPGADESGLFSGIWLTRRILSYEELVELVHHEIEEKEA